MEASWARPLKALDFSIGRVGLGVSLFRMYSHIQLASKLSPGCDYALFKVNSALMSPSPKAQGPDCSQLWLLPPSQKV